MSEPLTLIFDLDDTLIQSFPGYVTLHQRVAEDLGWRRPSEEELIKYGPTWEATVARIWPGVELAPFFERFDEIVDSVVYAPFEGALEAIKLLRERRHRLFIVTKRSSKRLYQRLAQAGIDSAWFEGIYPADYGPAPKPDPRCFEPVWQAIGWQPAGAQESTKALYIGDRREDQLAARRAGIPFVAVLSGPESHQGFPESGALKVLQSVKELPDFLLAQQ